MTSRELIPVFICGHYRSGTSLINHLLDGHSDVVTCPIETKFLSRYIHMIKQGVEPEKALNTTLLRYFYRAPEIYDKAFGNLDQNQFLDSFRANWKSWNDDPNRALDAFISACFNTMHSHESAKIWLEKTPMNEIFIDEILELWPNAKFIHILRDPRDMHHTIRSRSDFDLKPRATAINWLRSYEALKNNQKRLGTERYYTLTYEQLTSEPREQIQGILDFLNLKFQDVVLEPSSASGQNKWGGNAQHAKHQGVTTKSVGKWRKSEFLNDIKVLESVLASRMKLAGYIVENKPDLGIAIRAVIDSLIIQSKLFYHKVLGTKSATL